MTDPNGTTSFGFDAWGRMTSKARALNRATFDFNYDSLLTEYTTTFPDEASVSFEYDAHRLLRQRTAASSTRHFRWFGDYLLTSEDTNGELIATNIEGYLGQVSGNDPSLGSYRYSGLDVLTSPRRLRDSNKSIVAIHEYDPFGLTHSSFGETLFYGFSGLIPNPGLKLYYAPFRSLMPDSGRWLTPDPLHMIDGLNMYLYVHANPVVGIDYLGLSELFNDASLAGAFCNGALDGAMQAWDTIVWPTFTECYNPNDPGMRAGAAAATVADFAMPTGRCKGAAKGLGAVARKAGGSGKPRQLIILLPNRKCAEEAARKAGKGRTPVHHPRTKTDPTAPPHFHPTCKDGSVLKDGSHYCYPGLRPKTVRK
jgi:RHS repeat-associated protein